MDDSLKLVLGVPRNDFVSPLPVQLIAIESFEFRNGKFYSGEGQFYYPNTFSRLNLEFSELESIKVDGKCIKNNVLKLDRALSECDIWDPFIFRYGVKSSNNPIDITCSKDRIAIKMTSADFTARSLVLSIFLTPQDSRPHLDFLPKNLTHKVQFKENDMLELGIDCLRSGSEYALEFKNTTNRFKILRIEASSQVENRMLSGLKIRKCVQYSNDSEIINIGVSLKSKLKHLLLLD